MKLIPVMFFFACVSRVHGQSWHASSDSLRYPSSNSKYAITVNYFAKRYDTVPCFYKLMGSDLVLRGYKYAYLWNGFYIDKEGTMGIFFDEHKRRIEDVSSYYLIVGR